MRVLALSNRDFRCYASAEVAIGENITVVHGPNGAGKTNLLEALYFGCTGRSIRATNEREMVHFGAQATRVVVGTCDEHGAHELSAGYEALPGTSKSVKHVQADGVTIERLS